MSEKTSKVLTEAMLDVVKNPDGTGRRAALPSFPFAMKTGTAGEGASGYDAIIIGFGPVPNPKSLMPFSSNMLEKLNLKGQELPGCSWNPFKVIFNSMRVCGCVDK